MFVKFVQDYNGKKTQLLKKMRRKISDFKDVHDILAATGYCLFAMPDEIIYLYDKDSNNSINIELIRETIYPRSKNVFAKKAYDYFGHDILEEYPSIKTRSFDYSLLREFVFSVLPFLDTTPKIPGSGPSPIPRFSNAFFISPKEWLSFLEIYMDAFEKAKELAKKYNVVVIVLKTNNEYFKDSTIENTIKHRTYFVSKEDAELTGAITEYLLNYIQLRDKSLLKVAHAKRTDTANQIALPLHDKIEQIKAEYNATHNGKEAPLSTIADILTQQGIEAPNGGTKWFAQTVKRIIERNQMKR